MRSDVVSSLDGVVGIIVAHEDWVSRPGFGIKGLYAMVFQAHQYWSLAGSPRHVADLYLSCYLCRYGAHGRDSHNTIQTLGVMLIELADYVRVFPNF